MSSNFLSSSKIIPFNFLELFRTAIDDRCRVVATNGCFDILHVGHATYLQKAKTFGDVLILGVDSDSLVKASNRVNDMADTYEGMSNSLTGLVGSQDASTSAGDNLQRMNANLDSLNNMYEMQLEQLKENKALFDGMGELIKTLNDSVEDTRAYKEHIAELAQNLATLNTVYGNMLNAMGGNRS